MAIAKFLSKLTACSMVLWLIGCTTQPQTVAFNRSEAAKARINLALAYLEQQDYPKARENIDKALSHDSNDYLPYSVLAYYYQQTGEVEQAQQTYLKALTLSQQQSEDRKPSPDVVNNYGTFLCKQGEFTQAYQQFDQALNSEHPYYHQTDTLENIILCAKQERNTTKIAETLQQLSKLDKAKADALR